MSDIVTLEQLKEAPWREAIDNSGERLCDYFPTSISQKIKELGEEHVYSPALLLIARLCSMPLNSPDEPGDAFGTGWVVNSNTTMQPFDLTPQEAEVLFNFLPKIDNHELKARIADVLWESKQHIESYKAAKIAIESYIKTAEALAQIDEFGFADRSRRAVAIAVQLGKGARAEYESAITSIRNILDTIRTAEPHSSQYDLLKELLDRREGDPNHYAQYCAEMAQGCEQTSIHLSRNFLDTKAKWHRLAQDETAVRETRQKEAKTYLIEAEQADSAMHKSRALSNAVEAYRRLGNPEGKADELHAELLKAEKEALSEMQSVTSGPYDIREIVQRTIEEVSGQNLIDALFYLTTLDIIDDPNHLRDQTIKLAQKNILSFLTTGFQVNGKGKTVSINPGFGSGSPDDEEAAIEHAMHRNLLFNIRIPVQGCIEPARHQINLEHSIGLREMYGIVRNNPFVPQGREIIFARGLKAGFDGDFMVAMSLLVPQIENSLRYIIEQKGGISSTLSSSGIQKEKGLDAVLDDPIITDFFPDAIIFALKVMLIENSGGNFRHEQCHGLLDDNEFNSFKAVYIWWLILRLCCIPLIFAVRKRDEAAQDSQEVDKTPEEG